MTNTLSPFNQAARFTLRSCAAAVIAASSFVPSVVFAEPVLNGNTITWSNSDWYQVQRSDNYESVCEGRDPCTVEPGEYKVVNLTTGERFDNITVQATADSTVTVDGNVIRYPDNGWYQVQRATDYSSVCNGEPSCTVEPGVYNVINHSLGQRFDGIEVTGDTLPTDIEGTNNIAVTDNLIEWPDNGWYQVLNAGDYTEVCAGGSSCVVEPGTYIVINHSTGDRYEGVEVGNPPPVDVPPQFDGPVSLDDAAEDILYSLAGYQLDVVGFLVEYLTEDIIGDQEGTILSSDFSNDNYGDDDDFDLRIADRTRYTCNDGGTIVVDSNSRITSLGETTSTQNNSLIEFSSCQHVSSDMRLLPGTISINGTVGIDRSIDIGNLFEQSELTDLYSFTDKATKFTSFELIGSDSLELRVDGNVRVTGGVDEFGDASESRGGEIYSFYVADLETGVESINDSRFSIIERTSNDTGSQGFSVDIDGQYTGPESNGVSVTVRTEPTLTRLNNFNDAEPEVQRFTGSVRFESGDGSVLTLNANPADQPSDTFNNLLFDSVYFPAQGGTESKSGILFQPFEYAQTLCLPNRDPDSTELECTSF